MERALSERLGERLGLGLGKLIKSNSFKKEEKVETPKCVARI